MRSSMIVAAVASALLLLAALIFLESEQRRKQESNGSETAQPNDEDSSPTLRNHSPRNHNTTENDYAWAIQEQRNRQRRKPMYFRELEWEPACAKSYYDYVGTLYFCSSTTNSTEFTNSTLSAAHYGYQLQHHNGQCHIPDSDGISVHLNPLIRVQAGLKYQLRLVNLAETKESTSLHVHGIYLPGSGNADNVFLSVDAGNYIDYNWSIPIDHTDGTFLYHAHHLTDNSCQINGGAYGIFLVDPPLAAILKDDNRPPPALVHRQRLLLLTTTRDPTDKWKIQYHAANGIIGPSSSSSTTTASPPSRDDVASSHQVVVELQANAWHRVRVLIMDAVADIRLLRFGSDNDGDENLPSSPSCQVHVAAYDGVWRSTVPSPHPQWEYNVTGATRIDFAVKCQRDGALWYYENYDSSNSQSYASQCPPVKVRLQVTKGRTNDQDSLLRPWTPTRPSYLKSLIGESEKMASLAINKFQVNMTPHSLNGLAFAKHAESPLSTMEYGTVQEWQLEYTQYHPFHLHVFHMQIISPDGCGNIFEYGEWYDTISAVDRHLGEEGNDQKAPCLVRFAVTQAGRILFHCHTMEHANAMAWVQVTLRDLPHNEHEHVEQQPFSPSFSKTATCEGY